MIRILSTVGVVLLMAVPCVAQSNGSDSNGSDQNNSLVLEGKSALQNRNSFGSRAPGSWVNAARSRHEALIEARVNGPRGGVIPELPEDNRTATVSTGGFGSLLNLAGSLLGGGGGSLGGMSTGTGSTGFGGMSQDDLVDFITNIANQNNGGTSGTTGGTRSRSATQKSIGAAQVINTLTIDENKPADRMQDNGDTTTTERSFRARLLESWASTFFSALTLGFQSNDFIDLLKDAIRPLVAGSSNSNDDSGSDDGGSDDDGGDDSGSDDGSDGGSGIEDVPDDGGDDDGSII